MVERFREPERAIAYLIAALRPHLDGRAAEVTWHPKGDVRPRTKIIQGHHLGPTMERFADRFSEAAVIHGLEINGYVVGAIQCRCHPKIREVCPHHCEHHYLRPLVSVILYKPENPPDPSTRESIVEEIHAEVHRDIIEHKEPTGPGHGRLRMPGK